jgi:polyisoprenoid-binding protein YceI
MISMKMPKAAPRTALTLTVALLVSVVAYAQSRTYAVAEGGGNRVQFTSDAPLERMTGTSTAVSGTFTVDPTNLASVSGAVEVRIATLRTGIDLRDEHLRSDTWLNAAAFPTARFEAHSVSGATALAPGVETRVTIRGNFTLHGRTHPVSANARVTWVADANGQGTGAIRVRARFNVRLTDYGVTIPDVVQLKVSNTIAVDVSIRANAG